MFFSFQHRQTSFLKLGLVFCLIASGTLLGTDLIGRPEVSGVDACSLAFQAAPKGDATKKDPFHIRRDAGLEILKPVHQEKEDVGGYLSSLVSALRCPSASVYSLSVLAHWAERLQKEPNPLLKTVTTQASLLRINDRSLRSLWADQIVGQWREHLSALQAQSLTADNVLSAEAKDLLRHYSGTKLGARAVDPVARKKILSDLTQTVKNLADTLSDPKNVPTDDELYLLYFLDSEDSVNSQALELLVGTENATYFRALLRQAKSRPQPGTVSDKPPVNVPPSSRWSPRAHMGTKIIGGEKDIHEFLRGVLKQPSIAQSNLSFRTAKRGMSQSEKLALRPAATELLEQLQSGKMPDGLVGLGAELSPEQRTALLEEALGNVVAELDSPDRPVVSPTRSDGKFRWSYPELLKEESRLKEAWNESGRKDDPKKIVEIDSLANFVAIQRQAGLPAESRISLLEMPRLYREWLVGMSRQEDLSPEAKVQLAEMIYNPSLSAIHAALKAFNGPKTDPKTDASPSSDPGLPKAMVKSLAEIFENSHLKPPIALNEPSKLSAKGLETLRNWAIREFAHQRRGAGRKDSDPRLQDALVSLIHSVDERGHTSPQLGLLTGGEGRLHLDKAAKELNEELKNFNEASEFKKKAIEKLNQFLRSQGKGLPSASRRLLLNLSEEHVEMLLMLEKQLTQSMYADHAKEQIQSKLTTLILGANEPHIETFVQAHLPALYKTLVQKGLVPPPQGLAIPGPEHPTRTRFEIERQLAEEAYRALEMGELPSEHSLAPKLRRELDKVLEQHSAIQFTEQLAREEKLSDSAEAAAVGELISLMSGTRRNKNADGKLVSKLLEEHSQVATYRAMDRLARHLGIAPVVGSDDSMKRKAYEELVGQLHKGYQEKVGPIRSTIEKEMTDRAHMQALEKHRLATGTELPTQIDPRLLEKVQPYITALIDQYGPVSSWSDDLKRKILPKDMPPLFYCFLDPEKDPKECQQLYAKKSGAVDPFRESARDLVASVDSYIKKHYPSLSAEQRRKKVNKIVSGNFEAFMDSELHRDELQQRKFIYDLTYEELKQTSEDILEEYLAREEKKKAFEIKQRNLYEELGKLRNLNAQVEQDDQDRVVAQLAYKFVSENFGETFSAMPDSDQKNLLQAWAMQNGFMAFQELRQFENQVRAVQEALPGLSLKRAKSRGKSVEDRINNPLMAHLGDPLLSVDRPDHLFNSGAASKKTQEKWLGALATQTARESHEKEARLAEILQTLEKYGFSYDGNQVDFERADLGELNRGPGKGFNNPELVRALRGLKEFHFARKDQFEAIIDKMIEEMLQRGYPEGAIVVPGTEKMARINNRATNNTDVLRNKDIPIEFLGGKHVAEYGKAQLDGALSTLAEISKTERVVRGASVFEVDSELRSYGWGRLQGNGVLAKQIFPKDEKNDSWGPFKRWDVDGEEPIFHQLRSLDNRLASGIRSLLEMGDTVINEKTGLTARDAAQQLATQADNVLMNRGNAFDDFQNNLTSDLKGVVMLASVPIGMGMFGRAGVLTKYGKLAQQGWVPGMAGHAAAFGYNAYNSAKMGAVFSTVGQGLALVPKYQFQRADREGWSQCLDQSGKPELGWMCHEDGSRKRVPQHLDQDGDFQLDDFSYASLLPSAGQFIDDTFSMVSTFAGSAAFRPLFMRAGVGPWLTDPLSVASSGYAQDAGALAMTEGRNALFDGQKQLQLISGAARRAAYAFPADEMVMGWRILNGVPTRFGLQKGVKAVSGYAANSLVDVGMVSFDFATGAQGSVVSPIKGRDYTRDWNGYLEAIYYELWTGAYANARSARGSFAQVQARRNARALLDGESRVATNEMAASEATVAGKNRLSVEEAMEALQWVRTKDLANPNNPGREHLIAAMSANYGFSRERFTEYLNGLNQVRASSALGRAVTDPFNAANRQVSAVVADFRRHEAKRLQGSLFGDSASESDSGGVKVWKQSTLPPEIAEQPSVYLGFKAGHFRVRDVRENAHANARLALLDNVGNLYWKNSQKSEKATRLLRNAVEYHRQKAYVDATKRARREKRDFSVVLREEIERTPTLEDLAIEIASTLPEYRNNFQNPARISRGESYSDPLANTSRSWFALNTKEYYPLDSGLRLARERLTGPRTLETLESRFNDSVLSAQYAGLVGWAKQAPPRKPPPKANPSGRSRVRSR